MEEDWARSERGTESSGASGKGGGSVGCRGLALVEKGNDPGYAGSTVVGLCVARYTHPPIFLS